MPFKMHPKYTWTIGKKIHKSMATDVEKPVKILRRELSLDTKVLKKTGTQSMHTILIVGEALVDRPCMMTGGMHDVSLSKKTCITERQPT